MRPGGRPGQYQQREAGPPFETAAPAARTMLKSLWSGLAKLVGGRCRPRENRRNDRRLPAHGTATLYFYFEDCDRLRRVRLNLVDISADGLRFRMAEKLALEQTVWIEGLAAWNCRGVVRHIEPDDDGFVVGVEVLAEEAPPAHPEPSAEPEPEAELEFAPLESEPASQSVG